MSGFDLRSRLVAGRPESYISGLDPRFASALQRLYMAAPPNIQQGLMLNSGFRSMQKQAELFRKAVAEHGSEAAARKWVAKPGGSRHNHGTAMDFKYASPEVRKWVHANAAASGIHFPLKHEPWHGELIGSRGKTGAPPPPVTAPGAAPASVAPGAPTLTPPAAPALTAAVDPLVAAFTGVSQTQDNYAARQRAKQEEEQRRKMALLGTMPTGLASLF